MTRARLFAAVATMLMVAAATGLARADEAPAPSAPTTAFAALVRATAAYEYGDMVQVVDAARPVAEGTLACSVEQRARALRFLGIGLFLTNRALGAENAFVELLRVDPHARLDPTTTRPEVVAFFEDIRHRHVAREWASRSFIWNFLPPVGQFQNGESATGWVVGGLEVAALATFVGCKLLSRSWRNPDNSYGPSGSRNSDERTVRVVEYASAGVFAAAYLYGVIDGIVHYYRPPDETSSSLSLLVFPGGGGLRLTF